VGHDHTGHPVQVGRVPEARGGAAEQSPFGVSPPSPLSARFPAGVRFSGVGALRVPRALSSPIPGAVAGAPLRRGARSVSIAAMLEANAPPRLPYVELLDCEGVAGLATHRAPSSHLFHLGCDFVARRARDAGDSRRASSYHAARGVRADQRDSALRRPERQHCASQQGNLQRRALNKGFLCSASKFSSLCALDPEARFEVHLELSERYLGEAEELLARGDYVQASEKAWGAAAQIVKAVAAREGA